MTLVQKERCRNGVQKYMYNKYVQIDMYRGRCTTLKHVQPRLYTVKYIAPVHRSCTVGLHISHVHNAYNIPLRIGHLYKNLREKLNKADDNRSICTGHTHNTMYISACAYFWVLDYAHV